MLALEESLQRRNPEVSVGLPKFLKDLLTGPDGETYAIGRVLGITAFFTGMAPPFVVLIQHQKLDFSALAVYFGAVCAGVAALIWGTNSTEPKAP